MKNLENDLINRKKEGLLRSLHPFDLREKGMIFTQNNRYIDLSSNDYLGLSCHEKMKEAIIESVNEFSVSSSASRLLSGDLALHHILEQKIASFKNKEEALVFNTGYQANVGIISSIMKKGDVVFLDKLSHASIIDGVQLSGAKYFRFHHNNTEHLTQLLEKERSRYDNAIIITETIFSMEGDKAPLKKIVELKEKYDCMVMVDEAHATGIFGDKGSGVAEEEGVSEKIDLIMGTFSKGLGSFGAYLACSKTVKEYLVNTCRSFIFSTALPAHIIAANIKALGLVKDEPWRRKELLQNADCLRRELKDAGFEVRGCSQIVPVIIGDNHRAIKISEKLQDEGFWVLPIRTPTVPPKEARIRLSLTYYHTKENLDEFVRKIIDVRNH